MTTFIPGRELARRFYAEAVQPIIDSHVPDLRWSAAFIGRGSDVLGFDSARSMDHDWGPRLVVFLGDEDLARLEPELGGTLIRELPETVAGFPTRYREFADDPGVLHMATDGEGEGPLVHRVRITSTARYLDEYVGVTGPGQVATAVWLTTPAQTLLELTSGEVFRDDLGELSAMRVALAWYPVDVWRYRLAAAWKRISQLEPFIGRTGEAGDDLGSQVIALSIIRDVMRLALLQERQYAPYAKWLGTAFGRLDVAREVAHHLDAARFARDWHERERGVIGATAVLAARQNALGLSEWVDPEPTQFFSRPYRMIRAEQFAQSLLDAVTDPAVRSLPPMVGGIDDFVDSTDALGNREFRAALRDWLRSR